MIKASAFSLSKTDTRNYIIMYKPEMSELQSTIMIF